MACENLNVQYSNETLSPVHTNCSSSTLSFNATEFSSDEEGLYQVPTGIVILLSLFYGTISITAVMGNSIVIWIILTNKRMHNVTYYFIANLALADIIIGLFSIPFQFQAALLQRWNLPHFMCPFCPFIQMLSVSVSIFTLTAIAVDRYRAVLKPLKARPSKFKAKVIIAIIWIMGALLGLPMALALRVKILKELDRSGRIHYRPFCNNTNLSDRTMMYYRCATFLLQYVMPLSIISFAYIRMAQRLWDARAPGNAEDIRDANILRNKKRVIKMMVIVVTLFTLCWLPLQTYNFLQDIIPEINRYRYINIIWFSFDWLAMSNSCYNPFIYGIYNEKFKREFQHRFPAFGLRHRSSTGGCTDSIDIDRATQCSVHTRLSLRYSHQDVNDWSKKFSSFQTDQHLNSRSGSTRKSLSRHSSERNYFDLREGRYVSKSMKNRSCVLVCESSPLRSSRSDDEDDLHEETRMTRSDVRVDNRDLSGSKEQLFDNEDTSSQAPFDSSKMEKPHL